MYLTNIPQEIEEYGFSKVLAVRYNTIHIKHILTEIFVRKTINIEEYLNIIDMDLFQYMEYMTNRIRRIYNFSRNYKNSLNDIVKHSRKQFFPTLELYNGLKNCIVLDFDGVVTSSKFYDLYKLCLQRSNTFICSANPTISEDWFTKRNLDLPEKIYSMKGKIKKIKQLLEIGKKYDHVFYVDDEEKYLEIAWVFGLLTYKYKNGKISNFSLNLK